MREKRKVKTAVQSIRNKVQKATAIIMAVTMAVAPMMGDFRARAATITAEQPDVFEQSVTDTQEENQVTTAEVNSASTLSNPRRDENGIVTYDCVWFGNYPQSDATGQTKDPIKWRVLSVDGNDAFLVADKNLDVQRYNDTYTNVTWETCTMRSWLNGYGSGVNAEGKDYSSSNFIDKAFTASEQSGILTTTVVNEDNPYYGTEGGNNTEDKIFLLSINEVLNETYGFSENYSTYDKARERANTAYVAEGGAIDSPMYSEGSNDWWWLRSPGYVSDIASIVGSRGYVIRNGHDVNYSYYAVCPALHLNLSSSNLYTYAGTVSTDGTVSETTKPTQTTDTTKTVTYSNNNLTYTVYDWEEGKLITPLPEALVENTLFGTGTTDTQGKTELTNTVTDAPLVTSRTTITKEGYRDYIFDQEIYHKDADLFLSNNHRTIMMRKLQQGDTENPYISTVIAKTSWGREYDAMTTTCKYQKWASSQNITVQVNAVWNGKTPATYEIYQKGQASYTSTDGKFTFDMGEDFKAKYPIYVKLTSTDGTIVEEETQWSIEGSSVVATEKTGDTIDLIKTESTGTLGDDIAFLAGQEFEFELADVKVTTSVEDNKVRVMIGQKDGKKQETFSEEEWKDWKKICEEAPDNLSLASWNKLIEEYAMTCTKNEKAAVKVCGYAEGFINETGDTIVAGKIMLEASAEIGLQGQYTVGVIPVYAKVNFGLKGGVEGGIAYNFTQKGLDTEHTNIKFSIEPYIKGEGGVGVMAVATVGLTGKASMPVSTRIGFEEETSLSVKGNMGLKVKLLMFEYSLKIAEAEWKILPKEEVEEASINSLSMNDFVLSDRSYLDNTSEWQVQEEQINVLETTETNSIEQVLQQNIYPDAEVQLVTNGDKKMLLWTEDDSSRNSINRSRLVYSIYQEDSNTWSEPKAVADDGTGDFAQDVVVVNNKIYVAWQNMTKALEDTDTLQDMAEHSQIQVAEWSEETGFETIATLGEPGVMAVLPKITVDETGKLNIAYVTNSENNLLLTSGENKVEYVEYSNGATDNLYTFHDIGLVTAMDMENSNGKKLAITIDEDGDLATLEDRKIHLYSGNNSEEFTASQPEIVSSETMVSNGILAESGEETKLFWYQDNGIYQMGADKTKQCIYQDITGSLTDDFQVISDKNGELAVIWTATDQNDNKQLEGILYDLQQGTWSKSVQISDTDASVHSPQGIFDDNKKLWFAYKKTGAEQTDLCVLQTKPAADLSIESAYCDENQLIPGATGKVSVEVKNNGTKSAEGFTMTVGDTTTNFTDTILAGESIVVEAEYNTPEQLQNQDVKLTVSNEEDIQEENNSYTLNIGHADLSVSVTQEVSDCFQMIHIYTTNESEIQSQGTLEIRKNSQDGEVIKSIDLGTISKGTVLETTYLWSEQTENYEEGLDTLYFVVKTDQEERYDNNNYDFVVAEKLTSESATPTVTKFPEATAMPTVSEAPEATVTPTVSETPKETATPTVSEAPEVTATPTVSEAPEATATPTVSEAPEETATPTVSEASQETATPTVSEASQETATPTISGNQENTVSPTITMKPQNTILPTITPTVRQKVQITSEKATIEYVLTNGNQAELSNVKTTEKVFQVPTTITYENKTYQVTKIGANAFKNQKNLTKIIVGDNITAIGNNAFYGCTKCKTITLGKNITSIGSKAFYKCTSLTKLTVPSKVTVIASKTFYGCSSLKTITLSKNTTSIGEKAFYKCTALKKITLPSKVKEIGKQSFYACKKLKNITIKTTKLTSKTIGSKAFHGIYKKAVIKVPKNKVSSYKKILKAKGISTTVKIKK